MPLLIKIENLTSIYKRGTPWEVEALSQINLEVHEGEVLGIMGPTGCGKSTLVQHMGGLLLPTNGKVYYRGVDINSVGRNLRTLRKEVGLVFQHPEQGLFEETVYDDVAFGARNLGLAQEAVASRVQEALELVGLNFETYRNRSPFELSGGEARRVALAGVLAMNPSVLILDEPTVGLDPGGLRTITGKIKELHERKGVAIVLFSHSMEEIAHFADRVMVIYQGRIAMTGTPRELFSRGEELKRMGLGVPKAVELMSRLQRYYPKLRTDVLTIDEARDEILKVVHGCSRASQRDDGPFTP